MRHKKSGRRLGRNSSHRKAMFRNMVTSLFKYDRIQTTDAKAKELKRWADHLITLAKRGDLHARRQALAIVREKQVVHKLFEEANEKFGHSAGGYTRIVKLGRRTGGVILPVMWWGWGGGHGDFMWTHYQREADAAGVVSTTSRQLLAFGFRVLVETMAVDVEEGCRFRSCLIDIDFDRPTKNINKHRLIEKQASNQA